MTFLLLSLRVRSSITTILNGSTAAISFVNSHPLLGSSNATLDIGVNLAEGVKAIHHDLYSVCIVGHCIVNGAAVQWREPFSSGTDDCTIVVIELLQKGQSRWFASRRDAIACSNFMGCWVEDDRCDSLNLSGTCFFFPGTPPEVLSVKTASVGVLSLGGTVVTEGIREDLAMCRWTISIIRSLLCETFGAQKLQRL